MRVIPTVVQYLLVAVLKVVFWRLSEDQAILAELV